MFLCFFFNIDVANVWLSTWRNTPEGRGRAGKAWLWPPSADDRDPGRCLSIPHRVASTSEGDEEQSFEAIVCPDQKYRLFRYRSPPLTFQRGVPEALRARRPGCESIRPHVGGRDGGCPIPLLGLRLRRQISLCQQLRGYLEESEPSTFVSTLPGEVISAPHLFSSSLLRQAWN